MIPTITIGLFWWSYIIQSSSSAFSPSVSLPSCSLSCRRWNSLLLLNNPIRSPTTTTTNYRSVVLFAKKKKQKKVKKRSGVGNGGGGGIGFGNVQDDPIESAPAVAQNPESADVVTRLNALYNSEEAIIKQEDDSSDTNNGLLRDKEEFDGSSSSNNNNTMIEKEELHYCQQQEQQLVTNEKKNNKQQLVQVSESPLIFTVDEFIDPDLCRAVQNDASGCFDLLYPEQISDTIFNGQESEMDSLLFTVVSSLDHQTTAAIPNSNSELEEKSSHHNYPDGLHMDTNNQCLNRHVTCILYLNDVPNECGGATVFPLARTLPDDPVLAASQRLLDQHISHTRQQMKQQQLKSDAHLLETTCVPHAPELAFQSNNNPDDNNNIPNSAAIRIQPKAGRLLVFFSRDCNGKDDPRAWHAGERIVNPESGSNRHIEKRILTLFKEVHYGDDGGGGGSIDKRSNTTISGASPLEVFLAPMVKEQRKQLQEKARLQRQNISSEGT